MIAIDGKCLDCDENATGEDQLCDGCRADRHSPIFCDGCGGVVTAGGCGCDDYDED